MLEYPKIHIFFLFPLGGVWKFYQISSLLVFTLENFMTQRFFFLGGGFRAVSPKTRRICYLVHYLVAGRLAGMYLASSRTLSPSALSCSTFPFYSHFFLSCSPEFTFGTFDLDYFYLIRTKGYRVVINNFPFLYVYLIFYDTVGCYIKDLKIIG